MVGVAAIGAGNWGRNLLRNLASLPEVRLKYVCDLDEETRRTMASLYPQAAVTADQSAALADEDVQAVVIAVEAPLHHALAKAALDAGKHTFVEKPLTLAGAESQELVDLAAIDLVGPCGFVVHVPAEDKVDVIVGYDQVVPDGVSGRGAASIPIEVAMGRDNRLAIDIGL